MCSYTGSSKNGVNGLISLRVFEFDYIYKTIPIPLTARGTARTVPVPYVEYGLVLYTIIVYTVLRFSPSVPRTLITVTRVHTGIVCENMHALGANLRKLAGQAKICTPPGGAVVAKICKLYDKYRTTSRFTNSPSQT